jgi:hypothetical protein
MNIVHKANGNCDLIYIFKKCFHVRNYTSKSDVLQYFRNAVRWKWKKLKLSVNSLFYNHFMDQGYMADVCMEPMFWFVDNFTKFLGPVSIIDFLYAFFNVILE